MGCGASTASPTTADDKAPPEEKPEPTPVDPAKAASEASPPPAEPAAAPTSSAPASPPPPTHERSAELFNAVHEGDASLVEELLAAGVPAGVVDEEGSTALIVAARGESECARLLMVAGCPLEYEGKNGVTALKAAVEYEDSAMVSMLMEAGALTPGAISHARDLGLVEMVAVLTNTQIEAPVRGERADVRRVSVSATAEEGINAFTDEYEREQRNRRVSDQYEPMPGSGAPDAAPAAPTEAPAAPTEAEAPEAAPEAVPAS